MAQTNDRRRFAMLVAAFAGTFIALLDLTIVNVALPTIQDELHADAAGVQWISDAFAVTLAALLLSGGALGDRYGRKRLFLTALAVFLVGSLICALAGTLGVLIAGRMLQGAATAVLIPGSMSLLGQAEPDPAKRAHLIGIWGMMASLAVVSGPLLGGALIALAGWPWIFLVNLPIGAAAILLGLRAIDESADPDHTSLDPAGQALAIVALGTLAYAVIGSHQRGWDDPVTIVLLAIAVSAAAALIAVELRQPRPMLPVRLFADARFSIVNGASVALGFGANGAFFLLSLYLQQARGNSAIMTGVLFLPMTLAIAPAALLSGKMTARHGARRPMAIGYLLTGAALAGMATFDADTAYLPIALLFALAGFGQGLAISPAAAAVLEIVARERSGTAAAVVNTGRQVGTALGIALLGTILATHTTDALPATFSADFVSGLRPALLAAGGVVLLAALLLVLMPATRRERVAHTPAVQPEHD